MLIRVATLVALISLHFLAFAKEPLIRQGMGLSEARTEIVNSGYQIPEYNKACLTHAQTLLPTSSQKDPLCGIWQIEFLQEFAEYNGAAASAPTLWAVYRDGYGQCVSVEYGYDEQYIKDPDPSRLLAGLRVVSWKTCEELDAPTKVSEERIPLKVDGGVFTAPVNVNGVITLDFIIDSGAAEVSIPADVVMTLLRAGTIAKEDFLQGQTYVLADGSSVKGERFIVRKMQAGSQVVNNVPASVSKFGSPLLLGQSFLRAFDTWRLDNKSGHLVIGVRIPLNLDSHSI